jgi:uncharacterized membrane protein YjdF
MGLHVHPVQTDVYHAISTIRQTVLIAQIAPLIIVLPLIMSVIPVRRRSTQREGLLLVDFALSTVLAVAWEISILH